MKKLKKILPTILLSLIFLIGLGILLYPTVSSWWNSRVQSRAVAVYDEAVAALSKTDYSSYYEEAKEYNERLYQIGSYTTLANPDIVEGYEDTLNISGDGVIAYITIDKINVNLPIYHDTTASALSAGAGHLKGSSLPIGGENTHSVISAHRGLPSSRMFTDLDKLEVGDIFQIHVLGDTLTYQIDQIVTVLPTEIEELYIKKGEDYCTLMTCTPYGINTHRLLLRGRRIETEEELEAIQEEEAEEDSSITINPIWIIIAAAVVFVLVVSEIIVRILQRKKKK